MQYIIEQWWICNEKTKLCYFSVLLRKGESWFVYWWVEADNCDFKSIDELDFRKESKRIEPN